MKPQGTDTINKNEKNEKKGRKSRGCFTPPSAQEVTDYAKSIGFTLKGQDFIDHYQANGWMRGKTKIQDWKACVRTWKSNRQVQAAPLFERPCRKCGEPADFEAPDNCGVKVPWCKTCQPRLYAEHVGGQA